MWHLTERIIPGVSPCVARRLALVAPRLAPLDLVTFANVRMSENSVDHVLLHYAVLRETSHTTNPAAIKQPRGTSIGSACSPRQQPRLLCLRTTVTRVFVVVGPGRWLRSEWVICARPSPSLTRLSAAQSRRSGRSYAE